MNAKQAKLGLILGVTGALLTVVPSTAAMASTEGERNTTIALGAATLFEALSGKTTNAAILGGATAIAYSQYENSVQTGQNAGCPPQFSLSVYGTDGYNQQGFDRFGYDRDGFNRQGYNRNGFDRQGNPQNSGDRDGRGQDRGGKSGQSGNNNGPDQRPGQDGRFGR